LQEELRSFFEFERIAGSEDTLAELAYEVICRRYGTFATEELLAAVQPYWIFYNVSAISACEYARMQRLNTDHIPDSTCTFGSRFKFSHEKINFSI
jgi:hypothetical protein